MKCRYFFVAAYILFFANAIVVGERTNWKSPIPSSNSSSQSQSSRNNGAPTVPNASSYAFSYNDTSPHVYTVYMPKLFKDSDATGLKKTVANPDFSSGSTKTTFKAHMEWQADPNAWFLRADTSLTMYGAQITTPNQLYPVLTVKDFDTGYSWLTGIQLIKGDDGNFYFFGRTVEDPYILAVWAMSRDDYTSYLKSSIPKNTDTVQNTANWTKYSNNHPFSYNDTSVHTYTVLIPQRFLDTDDDETGLLNTIARPDSSAGYTTTSFKAYMSYFEQTGNWFLKTETSLVISGQEVLPAQDSALLEKKSEFLSFVQEYGWPPYVQTLYSSECMRDYYFVQSASDPYTIILWGMDID